MSKSITQVVARNLAKSMAEQELTQQALAEKAGVSQKTISNYLKPEQRTSGSKGKPPSPKLAELELIANALGIEAWKLCRPVSDREQAMYDAIEKAYRDLISGRGKPGN